VLPPVLESSDDVGLVGIAGANCKPVLTRSVSFRSVGPTALVKKACCLSRLVGFGLVFPPRSRASLYLRAVVCTAVTLTLTRGVGNREREAPRASLQLNRWETCAPGAPVGLKSSSPTNCCGTGVHSPSTAKLTL